MGKDASTETPIADLVRHPDDLAWATMRLLEASGYDLDSMGAAAVWPWLTELADEQEMTLCNLVEDLLAEVERIAEGLSEPMRCLLGGVRPSGHLSTNTIAALQQRGLWAHGTDDITPLGRAVLHALGGRVMA